jgi:hypothetical protein
MANKMFNDRLYSYEKKPVSIFAEATFGASGAVTLSAAHSKGVKSITKVDTAGCYLIHLQDQFQRLMSLQALFELVTGPPTGPLLHLLDAAVDKCGYGYVIADTLVATNAFTVYGVTFTCVASGATGDQFNVGASDAAAVTNLVAVINANATLIAAGVTAVQIQAAARFVIKSKQPRTYWSATAVRFVLSPTAFLTNPGLMVQCLGDALTAEAPASGEKVYIELKLSDTNIP